MINLVIVLAIALAIVLGYKTGINTGLFAMIFGYVIGCIGLQLAPKTIIAAWPISTMFSIMTITFFYSFALINGTLEKLARYLLYYSRKFPSMLPYMLFFVAAFISALGAGNFAVVAFMAPLTLMICEEIHMSKLIGAIAINCGSLAGGNFMTSNLGIVFRGLMDEAVGSGEYITSFNSFLCSGLIFGISILFSLILLTEFRFFTKHGKSIGTNITFEKPEPFTEKQRINLILMIIMLASVLIFPILSALLPNVAIIGTINGYIDVSLIAVIFAVLALVFDLAPQKEAIAKVPWNTIIMVCGVGILIQVAIMGGTVDLMASWMGANVPAILLPVAFAAIASFMSFFSSTIGVVCPALFPLIPALSAATGLSPFLLFTCTVIGSQSSAISPFSSSGSMIVGSSSNEEERNKLFSQLIFRAVPTSICTAVILSLILSLLKLF